MRVCQRYIIIVCNFLIFIFEMICSETQGNASIIGENYELTIEKFDSNLSKLRNASHVSLNCREVTQSRITQRQFDTMVEPKINSIKNPQIKCQSCQAWEEWALDSERNILLIEKKMIERQKNLHEKMKFLKQSFQTERRQFVSKQQQYEQQKSRDEQLIQKLNSLVQQLKNQIQSSTIDQSVPRQFFNQAKGFNEQFVRRSVQQISLQQNATVKNCKNSNKNNQRKNYIDNEISINNLKSEPKIAQSINLDLKIDQMREDNTTEKWSKIQNKVTQPLKVSFDPNKDDLFAQPLTQEGNRNFQNTSSHENINSIHTHESEYFDDPSILMNKFKKMGKLQSKEESQIRNNHNTQFTKQSSRNSKTIIENQKDILQNKSEVSSKEIPSINQSNMNSCRNNQNSQDLQSSLSSLSSSQSSFEQSKKPIKNKQQNYAEQHLILNDNKNKEQDIKQQIYGIWQQFDQKIIIKQNSQKIHKQNNQKTRYSAYQHQNSPSAITLNSQFRKPIASEMKKSFAEGQVQKQLITKFSGPKKLSAGGKTLSHNNLFNIKNVVQTQKQISQPQFASYLGSVQSRSRLDISKGSSVIIQPVDSTNARKSSECSEQSNQTLKDKRFSFSKNTGVRISRNSDSIFGQNNQIDNATHMSQLDQIRNNNHLRTEQNSNIICNVQNHQQYSASKKIMSKQALQQACSEIVSNPSPLSTLKTIKLNNSKQNAQKSRTLNQSNTDCSYIQMDGDKYSQHGSHSTNYNLNYNHGNRGLAVDQLKTVVSHCYTNYDQKQRAPSHFNMKRSDLRSQVIEQQCENQVSNNNRNHLMEEMSKLQFENENLKSYNRVLLQKLSNSRPRKY